MGWVLCLGKDLPPLDSWVCREPEARLPVGSFLERLASLSPSGPTSVVDVGPESRRAAFLGGGPRHPTAELPFLALHRSHRSLMHCGFFPQVGTNLTDIVAHRKITIRELGGCMSPIWSSYYGNCHSLLVGQYFKLILGSVCLPVIPYKADTRPCFVWDGFGGLW